MLLSLAIYTCSAQFFNARNNNCMDKAFGIPTSLVNESAVPFDVWSKSQGVIKLTKTFVNKVVCSDILSLFSWHATLGMVWAPEPKVFTQKLLLPNGKCGARNNYFYFIVVLFYSTGQRSSLDVVFYSIGLRSVYVDRGLKRLNGSAFLFVWRWQTKNDFFCLKSGAEQKSKGKRCFLRLNEHCCPLFVWDNYSKLDPF